jgi:hypothetical protein
VVSPFDALTVDVVETNGGESERRWKGEKAERTATSPSGRERGRRKATRARRPRRVLLRT